MADMLRLRLRWDDAKDQANRRKHGVSFEEACRVFTSGVEYLEILDELHSDHEDRFVAIGPIPQGRVLVIWTERDDGITRIIGARWANKAERSLYRSYMDQDR